MILSAFPISIRNMYINNLRARLLYAITTSRRFEDFGVCVYIVVSGDAYPCDWKNLIGKTTECAQHIFLSIRAARCIYTYLECRRWLAMGRLSPQLP